MVIGITRVFGGRILPLEGMITGVKRVPAVIGPLYISTKTRSDMKSWLVLLGYALLITGCTASTGISGKIELSAESRWKPTVYLIDPGSFDGIGRSYIGTVIDSVHVDSEGRFVLEKIPDAPEPVLLQLAIQQKGERFANQLTNDHPETDNYFPVIWQNGQTVTISANAAAFQASFSIADPSPENAALLALRDLREEAYRDYLTVIDTETHDESRLLDEEKAKLHFQQALMNFAEETPYLLPALTAIRWISVEADYERIPEFMVAQCERWQSERSDHPWVAQLCRHGDRNTLPVLQGDPIPDFSLPMLSGDTLALRQLLGEKLTILDLWASWCAPCRKENRNFLVPLWEQYHEAGFQIIGYALDASQKVWNGAIEKDGADRWWHASHLQGDDAPLLEQLRIRTIPANFLIDAEGRVVAKNLHGEELEQFVRDYFK